ncbi:xyloside xylosyltransferase 1 isoform X2 [Nerophis ophidion]|uniref:xyloside xylosyltransferase 1 isoform X2 n=1 Tax=Nerophis ophidion TaxID=159077 RepID=UPI002ADFD6E8|nr:xyloside xylosyltransferase 1 isoform X2 [Nerophis ophidion]
MGALRRACRVVGRVSTGRSYQLVLLLAGSMAVVAFYYFGSEKHNFSSTTKRIKQTRASHNSNRNDADLTADWAARPGEESGEVGGEKRHYHLLMMFTKVDKSRSLQDKFRVAMLSMVKHARFLEGEKLLLHFVSDQASRELAEKMLQEFLADATFKYEVVFHDVGALTRSLAPIVEAMQKHFSAGSGAYYSDAIFFLSVAMHRIMPEGGPVRSGGHVLLACVSAGDISAMLIRLRLGWFPAGSAVNGTLAAVLDPLWTGLSRLCWIHYGLNFHSIMLDPLDIHCFPPLQGSHSHHCHRRPTRCEFSLPLCGPTEDVVVVCAAL